MSFDDSISSPSTIPLTPQSKISFCWLSISNTLSNAKPFISPIRQSRYEQLTIFLRTSYSVSLFLTRESQSSPREAPDFIYTVVASSLTSIHCSEFCWISNLLNGRNLYEWIYVRNVYRWNGKGMFSSDQRGGGAHTDRPPCDQLQCSWEDDSWLTLILLPDILDVPPALRLLSTSNRYHLLYFQFCFARARRQIPFTLVSNFRPSAMRPESD